MTGTGQPLDLTACDREPIHIPGSIQPHGCLLVLEPEVAVVVQAAGDTGRLIGVEIGDLPGRPAREVLGIDPWGMMPRRLPGEAIYLGSIVPPARHGALDVLAHERNDLLVLELEPAPPQRPTAAHLLSAVRAAAAALASARGLRRLCDAAVGEVRALAGFDRVMVYRFLDDDSGSVIAEDKAPGLPSYLDHRYPASDIPRQARELYLRNLVRLIPDVGYAPAPLVPALCPATGRPLDMSDCALRSVSPVHVQYLRNMGVAASMSVSIVRDGALWGLIACHHGTPKAVPYELREACKHIGQILSQQVAAREEAGLHAEGRRLRGACDELVAILAASPSGESAVAEHCAELRAAIPSDGAAVVRGGEVTASGRTPDPAQIRGLADWLLAGAPRSRPYATDRLSEEHAPAAAYRAAASGLLAAVIGRADPLVLFWFRAEQVETIGWAGDPHKAVEPGADPGTLHPRRSFALWQETVRGRSRPWTTAEAVAAGRLGQGVSDLRQQWRIRALNVQLRRSLAEQEELAAQKDLLMREVNHRVQNSLQLVGSLLQLQAREVGDPSVREHFDEARRRLTAVAMVHRRLWRSDQIREVSFDSYLWELRDGLVQSWGPEWDEHVRVHVAPVLVPTDKAVTLALVITELATNAVKHAYGGGTGPIDVEVGEESRGALRVAVADRGTGGVAGRPEGFGSRLVGMLVGQLDGTLDRIDNEPGTRVVIRIDAGRER